MTSAQIEAKRLKAEREAKLREDHLRWVKTQEQTMVCRRKKDGLIFDYAESLAARKDFDVLRKDAMEEAVEQGLDPIPLEAAPQVPTADIAVDAVANEQYPSVMAQLKTKQSLIDYAKTVFGTELDSNLTLAQMREQVQGFFNTGHEA